MNDETVIAIVSIIAASATIAAGAVGAALGESRIGVSAMDALARQPDESGSITRTLFVSLARLLRTATACVDKGTTWSLFSFMRLPGIVQIAVSR